MYNELISLKNCVVDFICIYIDGVFKKGRYPTGDIAAVEICCSSCGYRQYDRGAKIVRDFVSAEKNI